MVKRTQVSLSDGEKLVAGIKNVKKDAAKASTVSTGSKDFGTEFDAYWERPGTGQVVSIREVDTKVEETRQSLADSLVRLEAGEAAVQNLQDVTLPALQETLDDLDDRITAGSTTTVWSTAAPDASTTGVTEGQAWLQTVSDADATVIGQWTWDGTAWKPVLIRSEVIAALDVSKLTAAEATIATAVIDKLFAQTFAAKKIAAGQIDAQSVAAAVGAFVKVDVGQLTATGADINSLVAQKIAGGIANFVTVNAENIVGGSFAGKTFTGGRFVGSVVTGTTVVGGLIKTRDVPTQGGLAIDSSTGLRAWNSSGKQTVQIDPSVGALRMGEGIYLTDPDRNGLVLNPPSKIGTASIYFTKGETMDANSAAIWRLGYDGVMREPLMLRGANGGGISVKGGYNDFEGNVDIGGIAALYGTTHCYGYLYLDGAPSTSQTANAYINPSNSIIARSTSSIRYKKDIEDWNPDPAAVLELRPRSWLAKKPAPGEDADARYVGLIAEEVEDLGLTELVGYDDEGRPDWLHYPLLAVAQQAVIRDQEARIAALEGRLSALEERVSEA